MPEQAQKLTNPRLQQAIAEFGQAKDQQHLAAVLAALVQAQLLVPARIQPGSKPPQPQADGRVALPADTRIAFTKLTTPQGEACYVAFADDAAFKAMQNAKNAPPQQSAVLLRFDGITNLLAKDKQAVGLLIDPFTGGVRIPRAAIEALAARMAAAAPIRPGEDVTIVEPSVLPDALLDPLCAVLAQTPQAEAAYLQLAIPKSGRQSYLLIVDGPGDRALMEKLAAAARPFLQSNPKKLGLTIVPAAAPLGQQGMQGSEPFYRRGVGRVDTSDEEDQP